MSYQIEFSRRAEKNLKRLSRQDQKRISDKIDALAQEPRPSGVEKLQGKGEDAYRIRVGMYRVLYEIRDRELVILVIKIGHRREVYRF